MSAVAATEDKNGHATMDDQLADHVAKLSLQQQQEQESKSRSRTKKKVVVAITNGNCNGKGEEDQEEDRIPSPPLPSTETPPKACLTSQKEVSAVNLGARPKRPRSPVAPSSASSCCSASTAVTSSSSLDISSSSVSASEEESGPSSSPPVEYVVYESELQMPDIMRLIQKDLSEPYSIYTYRYFIHNWPHLCFMVGPLHTTC